MSRWTGPRVPVSTDLPTLAAPAPAPAQGVPRTLSATLDAPPPDSRAPRVRPRRRPRPLPRARPPRRRRHGRRLRRVGPTSSTARSQSNCLHARVERRTIGESPLLREARAMARLTHPNVARRCYEVGDPRPPGVRRHRVHRRRHPARLSRADPASAPRRARDPARRGRRSGRRARRRDGPPRLQARNTLPPLRPSPFRRSAEFSQVGAI
jgi:hypothetical protein